MKGGGKSFSWMINHSVGGEEPIVIRHDFHPSFHPFSTQLPSLSLQTPFSLCSLFLMSFILMWHSHSQHTTRLQFNWYSTGLPFLTLVVRLPHNLLGYQVPETVHLSFNHLILCWWSAAYLSSTQVSTYLHFANSATCLWYPQSVHYQTSTIWILQPSSYRLFSHFTTICSILQPWSLSTTPPQLCELWPPFYRHLLPITLIIIFVVCDYFTQWSFPLLLQLICTLSYRTLHPFTLLPRFPLAFPLFSPIVPPTPSPTTPAPRDHAHACDSWPRHSRGHEACLYPLYCHPLPPPLTTPSQDLHVTGLRHQAFPLMCALWYRPLWY